MPKADARKIMTVTLTMLYYISIPGNIFWIKEVAQISGWSHFLMEGDEVTEIRNISE